MNSSPSRRVGEATIGPGPEIAAPAPRDAAPGLYIHVPFCARVCPYCDFAVQTGGAKKRDAYLGSLLREIQSWADRAASIPSEAHTGRVAEGAPRWRPTRPFDTIYLGGGTPSSLSREALEKILAKVHEVLPVAAASSITLEANPEDVSDARLSDWKRLGVSRLSLGVQSFDEAALGLLGRSHTPEQATAAIELSMAAGFEAVSLDLIFAVPGQSPASWQRSLQRAVELQPHHISCYELTVHERTRFYRARQRGVLVETPADDKAEQFFFTHRFLDAAGYAAYEVSNFARAPEFRSRHNAKYWDHTPYLGLGPSAHCFDGGCRRWWNERRLIDWQVALDEAGCAICEEETLTSEQLVLEALALGFRTTAGVDLEALRSRYDIDLGGDNAALIGSFTEQGLLQPGSGSVLTPTLAGLAVADTLAGAFEIAPAPVEIAGGGS